MPVKGPITMTTSQVAKVLGVSPRRVRQVREKIGYGWHGKQLSFRPVDVEKYRAGRK